MPSSAVAAAAARAAMAGAAAGVLRRAQAAASQLSHDPGVDPTALAAVLDAMAKAQATLDRLGAAGERPASQAGAQAAVRARRGLPPRAGRAA